jgi:putative transposase
VKRSRVVEADGGPLGAAIAGAHVHDTKLVAATLESRVVERPQPTEERPQPLCLDQGDDNPTGDEAAATYPYTPHIRSIGEETLDPHGQKTSPARRWVVERTLAWRSKCRGLLVRDEQNAINFLGRLPLACALIWMRRRARLIGA